MLRAAFCVPFEPIILTFALNHKVFYNVSVRFIGTQICWLWQLAETNYFGGISFHHASNTASFHADFRNPKWVFLVNTGPVALLLALGYAEFSIIQTLLPPASVAQWQWAGRALVLLWAGRGPTARWGSTAGRWRPR